MSASITMSTRCAKCRLPYELGFAAPFDRDHVFDIFKNALARWKDHGCQGCGHHAFEPPLYTEET